MIISDPDTRIAIAGGAAGITSAILVCPLDVVKVRMQSATMRNKGTIAALSSVYEKEGFKALYSGLTPTVLAYLTDRAIWFSTYENLKSNIADHFNSSKDKASVQVASVIMASIASDIVTTPIWVIRTRMMGIFAFYKGFIPSLIGVTHPMIQFPIYERLKILFHAQDSSEMNHFGILYASALSKMIAGLVTYPHEVIRTRLQTQITLYIPTPNFTSTDVSSSSAHLNSNTPTSSSTIHSSATISVNNYKTENSTTSTPNTASSTTTSSTTIPKQKYRGLYGTASTLIREEGWRSLYRGLSTNMIRTVPSTAVSLWIYEWLKRDLS